MYVPERYKAPSGHWISDLIRGNPLAELVSNGPADEGPFVTHVPIILDPFHPDQRPADLRGLTLWGHLNRANPHWEGLADGASVVAIFTGPNAYVSPAIYQVTPAAPTWDFTAVHVRATVRRVLDTEQTLATVAATVRAYEAEFGSGWVMDDSLGYFRQILPGVGAFRLTVSRTDAMFKLSQEQPPDVQTRIRDDFSGRDSTHHCNIARMMERLPAADH